MKRALGLFAGFFLSAAGLTGQEAVVAPNENLAVEGIPKVPVALADDVARYMEIRAAGFASWHPIRRELLVFTRFADTYQVHRVQSPGAARTQLTFFKDGVFTALYDPKNGDSFVFLRDTGGDEFFQLYRFDLADGRVTLVTDGKSRNTSPLWSRAGDRIAYGSTRRNGKDVDLWVVDPWHPESNNRLLVELSGGGWTPVDWSRDGSRILLQEGISANESYYWTVDAATGVKTLVTPRGGAEKIAYGGGRFSRDGRSIFLTTDRGSEFQRLIQLDPATGRETFLTSDTADVDEFDLSPDGRTIAYESNEKGISALRLLDWESRQVRAAAGLPIGVVSGIQWHRGGGVVGFTLASARSPYDAWSYDVRSGAAERWTFSETGGLNAGTFAEPELVAWKSFDGREITGFLYRPPARFTGKRPVIINIHGGPESQARPDFLMSENYFINELGCAMIFPNVRGSSGYGKTFLKLDDGFLREGAYKDIGALLDWIRTRPELDPDRVMVTGGSYGGHMTLAVTTYYPERIRCAVDEVGPSNLVTFLENTSGYRQDLRRVEYGDERDPKMRAFLERIAPARNAAKIARPLFVIQGANDPRVPRSESEQMVAVVRKNGTPVWYLLARDEGHGFSKKGNRQYQLFSTVLFVRQFLLN